MKVMKPLLVGVSGGTSSGKSSLCRRIHEKFVRDVTIVSLDSFYWGLQ